MNTSVNMSSKSKFKFNLLKIYRAKFVEVPNMITLGGKSVKDLSLLLKQPLLLNAVLSQGRVNKLGERFGQTKMFLTFVLKMYQHHGAETTVKWLKASSVAIQKELGQDRLGTLTTLGSALPYSRLTNGLPRIIPAHCRKLIRKDDIKEIRFWLGLFNLYRIIKCPGVIKTSTITDAFSGNKSMLDGYIGFLDSKQSLFFDLLKNIKAIRAKELEPQDVVLSRAASPSNSESYKGILMDIYLLSNHYPKLYAHIWRYLAAVNEPTSSQFGFRLQNLQDFVNKFAEWSKKPISFMGREFYLPLPFSGKLSFLKTARTNPSLLKQGYGLSQFALKEEAAGKIRLFALLDSISQMVLAPLHDMLFDILRALPNDGTFNQEESIQRSMAKAKKAGCAFSFDLTAATDRLPAILTANIIARITGRDIALHWLGIMTDRDFWFSNLNAERSAEILESRKSVPGNINDPWYPNRSDETFIVPFEPVKGNPSGPYHYAVGQPMGGLSSWAGLAVTHHWIVQLSAFLVTNSYSWNEDYEILGDDLVIFDPLIADKYCEIMNHLGCEINMHKSIVSRFKPVFEFAKRTCLGDNVVSGISFNQVRSGWNIGSIVANCYQWVSIGLIKDISVLALALSKYSTLRGKSITSYVFNSKTNNQVLGNLAMSLLSLFGVYHVNGKVSLKDLMTAIIHPKYKGVDFSSEA